MNNNVNRAVARMRLRARWMFWNLSSIRGLPVGNDIRVITNGRCKCNVTNLVINKREALRNEEDRPLYQTPFSLVIEP